MRKNPTSFRETLHVFLKTRFFLPVLLLHLVVLPVQAQVSRVTGIVKDKSGNPIPSVSVNIKGVTLGTTTNEKGEYALDVPATGSPVLVFSFVGYLDKEEPVRGRTAIDVVMQDNISSLDDVVVIGYGRQKKRDVTGAISSVSAKSIEERMPVTIFDALQGAAPGVRVMSESGAPGEEASITIRGLSTLSDAGVRPLYIVDGVPMQSITSINPKDIESMEILKDAASAAIYGSRSANGVVLITTKKGAEGKPQINIDYLRSYSSLSNRISQANRLERIIFDRRNSLGLDPKPDDSTAFSRNSDNDYQDIITQTAVRNQVDVSVRGGSSNLNYYNSLQYLDETGIIINSYNKRFTLRTNVEYKPSKRLTMMTRLNFSYQTKNNIDEGNVIRQALQRPPGMALYFPDGEFIYFNGGRRNPIAEAYLRTDISKTYRGILYQGFDFTIFTPLKLHLDASADVALARRNFFSSKYLTSSNPPINSGYDESNIPIRLQGNIYATFEKVFKGDHKLEALAGMNWEKNKLEEVNISGTNFVTENVTTLNAAGLFNLAELYSRAGASALLGFYGRVSYDYKGRYLLNATMRRDASSKFGPENRWGNFPSVSAGWRFSDEIFMERLSGFLTDGKVRVSWGITGNQEIGNYDSYQQFEFGSYFYNGVSGVRTSPRLGNAALKWEETTQTNFGIDLTFLNGAISFVGDYYIKETKDLLYDERLPNELGFPGSVRTNAGSIENRGIELSLTAYPILRKNFNWKTSINWSMVRNRITDLPSNYIDDIWTVEMGKEAGNFFGYKYLGIYQFDQSNAWTEDYSTMLTPVFQKDAEGNLVIEKNMQPVLLGYTLPDGTAYTGNVMQMTTNGVVSKGGDVIWQNLPDDKGAYNSNIGNEDRQFLGHGQPRWSIGISNSFTYKGFSLSFSLYGNFGGKIYNDNRRNLASFSNSNTTPDAYFIYNMWKYPGHLTDTYRGGDRTADNMRRGGSQFLESGDFLRLQSVRLGYQLPERLSMKAAMKILHVYIYGNNLLTWTEYTGFDPEVGQRSVLKPGNDPGRYPRRREIGMGLNITF
jgi:TonB-dependent starch-binding outer membrane protein SusC